MSIKALCSRELVTLGRDDTIFKAAELMRQNLAKLEAVALPLFRLGHTPMIGEWVALPLVHLAGSTRPGDDKWNEIHFSPATSRHAVDDRLDVFQREPRPL